MTTNEKSTFEKCLVDSENNVISGADVRTDADAGLDVSVDPGAAVVRTNRKAPTVEFRPVESIRVGERIRKDLGDLTDLTESMKRDGCMIEPLLIRKDDLLIYGERRLEAAKLLEWQEVPCIIVDGE
jgi:hypothetical protein